MRRISDEHIDRAARAFSVYWSPEDEVFVVEGHNYDAVLTPDQLADLSRALLRAAVTKGED
jgi:hypothetical protein